MEDLGTLGGPTSFAFGISQTGEVVGGSETAEGTIEAFLWTPGRGMRSLGTLGGVFGEAHGVNTHKRVVGTSLTANERQLPFLWTPERGLRRLPTLGGAFGDAWYLNEFGNIAGITATEEGAIRATLWVPAAGPLLAAAPGDQGVVPANLTSVRDLRAVRAAMCAAVGGRMNDDSRFGIAASRACIAR
jgi:probable HAF family extracellular repeat protein